MIEFISLLDILARGGGGGSGGGSGSGGGGGIVVLIGLIGFLPSYYLGKLVKKLLPRKQELIVSGVFAVISSIVLIVLGAAGGLTGELFMIIVVAGVWVGWAMAFFGVWDRLAKKSKLARNTINIAASSDGVWDVAAMDKLVRDVFVRFQQDWASMNMKSIASYTTARYAHHVGMMLGILRELGRRNDLSKIEILQCMIVDADDQQDNTRDSFTVAYEARMLDKLVDKQGKELFSDSNKFMEYWRFVRVENSWRLDSITQNTQDLLSLNASLRDFAERNNMFYSLDMGWLFLPERGLIFSGGKMGTSDINNHVVGMYHGRLAQLYTYCPLPHSKYPENYLIAQITLPKSYGGIIVRPDANKLLGFIGNIAPAGYEKHEFEWPDFNKRYDVHATDADRLAAFELINPGFMAYLYDNDPGVGIEVADNVLYLYKKLGNNAKLLVSVDSYEKMLTIALKAYKELEL